MDVIDSPKHPTFRAAAALDSALRRAADARYLVEGEKLVRQALEAGVLREAFVTEAALDLGRDVELAGWPCHRLPEQLVPRLIGTSYETAVTAVGLVERRLLAALPHDGLLLLAEGIQDPRNVGVLLRTAEAASVAAVGLTDDSADPFSRPAVRSTTGSLLRQPLALLPDLPAEVRRLREHGVRVVATSARATLSVWEADLRGPVAVLVGNESRGLSEAARDAAELMVALPVGGGASSLNVTVAAGVLLYEALRQRQAQGNP